MSQLFQYGPQVVTYVTVIPPRLVDTHPDSLRAFRVDVLKQAQGESVMLTEMLAPEAALTFSTLYGMVEELLVSLKNQQVLLIDNHATPVMHRDDRDDRMLTLVRKLQKRMPQVDDLACPQATLTIDIGELWHDNIALDDFDRTKTFLANALLQLKPTLRLALVGEVPMIPLLSLMLLARPMCEEMVMSVGEKKIPLFG